MNGPKRIDRTRAFPKAYQYEGEARGMALRDFFAAQVVTHSYIAHLSATELADQAYEIADAMMARRKQ